MSCDICGRVSGHDLRCPNYSPQKKLYYCSSCGEAIFNGEEYIENLNGEYRHSDCFHGIKDLLKWLGYEIKIMENTYE